MSKPFDSDVLLAKIKAILNRQSSIEIPESEDYKFKIGIFSFNSKLRILKNQINKDLIKLSPKESQLLKLMVLHLNDLMLKSNSDIGTLAAEIREDSILKDENIVKVITKEQLNSKNFSKALNFFRKNSLLKNSNIYHHIGIYIYKVSILEKFINFKQTKNEIDNRLEQLRALDNNIKIMVGLAKSAPIGVDTKEDFLAIKKIMEYK